jgi:hypothetical protein
MVSEKRNSKFEVRIKKPEVLSPMTASYFFPRTSNLEPQPPTGSR